MTIPITVIAYDLNMCFFGGVSICWLRSESWLWLCTIDCSGSTSNARARTSGFPGYGCSIVGFFVFPLPFRFHPVGTVDGGLLPADRKLCPVSISSLGGVAVLPAARWMILILYLYWSIR